MRRARALSTQVEAAGEPAHAAHGLVHPGVRLDSELTGPDGEKLSDDQRGQACEMILGEKDALTGYIEKAKADLAGKK